MTELCLVACTCMSRCRCMAWWSCKASTCRGPLLASHFLWATALSLTSRALLLVSALPY